MHETFSPETLYDTFSFHFIPEPSDVCRQPCQLNSNQNVPCNVNGVEVTLLSENCTSLKHYDYFTGSGAAYILTFLGLGLCVPGMHQFIFGIESVF